ncbi:MAG: hypothetical protein GX542_07210 [Rhodococcus sp.]|nr:hypothetical protein [Rhodococcus sp. (in: high G+C Gram-positive bacteria)]
MSLRTPVSPPAAFRGAAVGVFSGAFAVAAHAAAGGGLPHSSSLTLLAAACVGLGVLVAQRTPRSVPAFTAAALAVGQLLGHLVLAVETPGHALVPSGMMLAAHAVATVVCASAVSAAERLYGPLVSSVVSLWRTTFTAGPSPAATVTLLPRCETHATAVVAILRASISRRGPPVSA